MRFRILGPLRVRNGTDWLPVPAAKQRLLLSALLIEAGQPVSTQRLAHEIWGDQLPQTAMKTVTKYVMRLRRLLGDDGAGLLATRDDGYERVVGLGDLDVRERLGALNVVGEQQAGVKAAFDLSYLGLPEHARRLFRLLGLAPGPDLTAAAAGALAGLEPSAAAEILDRLAAAHLVDEHQPGRYALHDLIRQYASQKVATEESDADRRAALDRLHVHYLDHALSPRRSHDVVMSAHHIGS